MTKEIKEAIAESVKLVISIATGVGVEIFCGTMASNVVQDRELRPMSKACVGLAGAVVGGVISNAADEYIDKTVDGVIRVANTVTDIVKAMHEAKEE